jgi:hypothetical protein
MTGYINSALADMRGGRQNWRVMTFLSVPAFVIAFGAALLRVTI